MLTMMLTKANQSRGIRWIRGISRGKGSGGSRKSGCGEGGVEGAGTVRRYTQNNSMHTPS